MDYIIHASAMKYIHITEYNPDECFKTNARGSDNVIKAGLSSNVQKMVAISTDMACALINLYGATKLTSDKLIVDANNLKGKANTEFSVVRYGNVIRSNGSIIPFFLKKDKRRKITNYRCQYNKI